MISDLTGGPQPLVTIDPTLEVHQSPAQSSDSPPEFRLFRRLPAELRLKTWKDAFKSARPVKVYRFKLDILDETNFGEHEAEGDAAKSGIACLTPCKEATELTRAARQLLQVNSEARKEMLSALPPMTDFYWLDSTGNKRLGSLAIDFSQSWICLTAITPAQVEILSASDTCGFLDRVRHLGLPWSFFGLKEDMSFTKMGRMKPFAGMFDNLQTLAIDETRLVSRSSIILALRLSPHPQKTKQCMQPWHNGAGHVRRGHKVLPPAKSLDVFIQLIYLSMVTLDLHLALYLGTAERRRLTRRTPHPKEEHIHNLLKDIRLVFPTEDDCRDLLVLSDD